MRFTSSQTGFKVTRLATRQYFSSDLTEFLDDDDVFCIKIPMFIAANDDLRFRDF